MAEIPGTSNAVQPFIAAIHPSNADRIFVRTDDWEGPDDYAAQDALLQTTDAGKTWTEVLRKNAKLFGFALSPGGDTVLAGYGDPVQAGGQSTNSDDFGIYKATTAGLQFERIYAAAISCLRWTGQGLYACMVQNHPELPSPGMSLGFAPNANFTAMTPNPFTSLLDVKKVKGPLACVASQCTDWSTPLEGAAAVCEQLGATCAVDTSKNVLSCASSGGSGGAAGSGGSAGSGGAAGSGSDGGRDAGMGGSPPGCLCALPASGGDHPAATLVWLTSLLALAAGVAWRRRRSRPKLSSGRGPSHGRR
jgi:MYXO-CTERM domain-containing protein